MAEIADLHDSQFIKFDFFQQAYEGGVMIRAALNWALLGLSIRHLNFHLTIIESTCHTLDVLLQGCVDAKLLGDNFRAGVHFALKGQAGVPCHVLDI